VKHRVKFYDFSPDGGDTWFSLTDKEGRRVWSTGDGDLPQEVLGWRTNVRHHYEYVDFRDDENPENVWGDLTVDEDTIDWPHGRTQIRATIQSSREGIVQVIEAGGESFVLRREAVGGEPIWKVIGDGIKWSADTLGDIEPLGFQYRDVMTYMVDALDVEDEIYMGGELRYWEFMHGWLAISGGGEWGS
jgi:hypothetical protein